MTNSRTIPLLQVRRASVSTAAGADPDELDEAQAYGEFPDVIEHCVASPTGQCQYDYRDGHENCIHCGKGEGVL